MKISLRDLFWLALLIASLTAWAIEHRKAEREIAAWQPNSWFVRNGHLQPTEAERLRLAAVKKFARFTDEQLDLHFASLPATEYYHGAEYEPCLTEMARRRMSAQLQQHYDALMANDQIGDPYSPVRFPNNLELLTALRRSQNKPDPLRIDVELSDHWPYGNNESVPTVLATVTNIDVGMEAVSFKDGGDDRGGRRERWQLVLIDEQRRRAAV